MTELSGTVRHELISMALDSALCETVQSQTRESKGRQVQVPRCGETWDSHIRASTDAERG